MCPGLDGVRAQRPQQLRLAVPRRRLDDDNRAFTGGCGAKRETSRLGDPRPHVISRSKLAMWQDAEEVTQLTPGPLGVGTAASTGRTAGAG